MKNVTLKLLQIAALSAIGFSAFAQTKDIVLDVKSTGPLPYVIDARGVIARSGTGLCVRTGYWTKELAANTRVIGGEFPAGCACDKDLMPKAACEAQKKAVVVEKKRAITPDLAVNAVTAVKPVAAEKVTVSVDAVFDFNKAVLSNEGKAKLDDVASKAGMLKTQAISVVGHSDRIGSTKYNQKLSERRAEAAKSYLVNKGIAADRISTEGKGASQPVTKPGECKGPKSKKVIACLQPNRHVVVELTGTK